MSPSVQSISDIFAKTASSKVASKTSRAKEDEARAGSPSVKDRKPSLAEEERTSSPDIDLGGKKTPEDLVRRHHGVGHGTNPDLMAEIKEKRASMAHKLADEDSKSPSTPAEKSSSQSGLFGAVKLR